MLEKGNIAGLEDDKFSGSVEVIALRNSKQPNKGPKNQNRDSDKNKIV